MQAEVISIGDELTSGQRLDTNSRWLSERLEEIGIRVMFHTTVGDDLTANVRVFHEATNRADIVVSTGGLGPTADDLTRFAIAKVSGRELVLDEKVLKHIRARFRLRRRAMPESNVVQARFPSGSRVIPNPHGTAPGIDMDITRSDNSKSRVFALPGVPVEMREMWEETVRPGLEALPGRRQQVIRHRRIKCFGVGESDLEQMLPDLIRRGRQPSVGITVSEATITLRITAAAESVEACFASMEPTIQTIHDSLGDLVFGEEDDELSHAVARLLAERKQTVALAEYGTGGLVARWLSETPEAKSVFRGGIVLDSSQSAASILQASSGNDENALLSATAKQVRQMFCSDFAVVTGRFPNDKSQPDDVEFAVIGPSHEVLKSIPTLGHPEILKPRSAKLALNFLRLAMLDRLD